MIEIFTTRLCGDCIRTKDFLKENDIDFNEIIISGNQEAISKVIEINQGNASVPTIIFEDGTTLTEPSNQELAEKLGLKFS